MRKSKYERPLTVEEQAFATENHYLIKKYLRIRRLPYDDWYDVVIFRYLLSVKRWFAISELHKYNFEIIAFYAMHSAIGNEQKKQRKQVQTVSLDAVIPGTDNFTFADILRDPNSDFTRLMA